MRPALLVACALVLAGCAAGGPTEGGAGPAATAGASPSATPQDGPPQLFVQEVPGLPVATAEAAAVWTGQRMYVFGGQGRNGTLDTVIEFDPAGSSDVLPGRLPTALRGACAAWDGAHAYLFGGLEASGRVSEAIHRFDPGTGTVERMEEDLPAPLWRCAAVHAWGKVYILGGSSGDAGDSAEVLTYTPTEGLGVAGLLPEPIREAAAVWAGDAIWVLGGTATTFDGGQATTRNSNRILGVAENGTSWTEEATLPGRLAAKWSAAALWDGRTVYLAGGKQAGLTQSKQVMAFDPVDGTTWEEPVDLPYEVTGPVAAWTPSGGLVLGGIVDHQPTPRAVRLFHLP